ncbi:hypothetical protein [Phenylobacterium sp.]|jgi:hypothetical protein|uniref:hypothetical protein n=1 Tax=Phenylobacterium sp. TaxID=1871053 RepID=UPI002F953E9F
MAPRLKVFVTSDGFTDYVVATSSRAKALAAWGSHLDLFKTGMARETDDPDLVAAANAQPGEVLRRPAGTRGELAKLKPPKKDKPAGPSKAALKKIADLEARLAALDAAHQKRVEALEREQARLAAELQSARNDYAAQRAKVEDALSAARQALG